MVVIFLLSLSLWASASIPAPPFSESRIVRMADLSNGKETRQQFVILDDSSLWVRPMPSFGKGAKVAPTFIPTPNFYSNEFLAYGGRLFVVVQTLFTSDKLIAEIRPVAQSKWGAIQYGKGAPYFIAGAGALVFTAGDVYEGKLPGAAITGALAAALFLKAIFKCKPVICSEIAQRVDLLKDNNGMPYRIRDIKYNRRDYSIDNIEMSTTSGAKVLLSEFLQIEECVGELGDIDSPPVAPQE